jgi:hypothetical protein
MTITVIITVTGFAYVPAPPARKSRIIYVTAALPTTQLGVARIRASAGGMKMVIEADSVTNGSGVVRPITRVMAINTV